MGENKTARKPGDALIGIGTVLAIVFAIFGLIAVSNGGTFMPWLIMFIGFILIGIGYMQRIAAK